MKKYLLLIPSLLILAVTGFILLNNNDPTPPSELTQDSSVYREAESSASAPENTETIFVRYGNSGFVPQRITVMKGTTVSFINESDMPLWVASDPHPEHTDYPEFDSARDDGGQRPQMGENFEFVFNKTGTWNYHSHNASSDAGTEEVHPGTVVVK